MTIPLWTKAKAVVTYDFTRSLRSAAEHAGVSKSSVSRWRHDIHVHKVSRRRTVPTWAARDLVSFVTRNPLCTLHDMQRHLESVSGRRPSLTTVHRIKTACKITRKRLTKMVDPRTADPAAVTRVCDALATEHVVSIDETCFYIVDRLRYGYAVRGRRARVMTGRPCKVRNVRRCTVLAAISSDGVIDFEMIEGSCNQDIFSRFVSRLNVPSGTQLLMDNVRFHDTRRVREAIRDRGFQAVFTPPYSPWCNPIELAFSKVKTVYRTHAQSHPSSDVDEFIGRVNGSLMSVTARDCRAFFSHVQTLVSVPLDHVATLLG